MTEKNRVHRFVSKDLTLRAAAVDATAVVKELQTLQNTKPLATLGVGRAMVGALLMASQLKDGQQVGILLKGNGPLQSLYAEATFEGDVRGYCPYPDYMASQPIDILNLGKALGFGQMTVARHSPFQRQPFQGTVEMATGEVGDDIAHYLHQSHQIRSIVSLGVYLDSRGAVQAAGGVLIEVMPGVEDEVAEMLQTNARGPTTAVSKRLYEGAGARELLEPFFAGIPYTEIPHDFGVRYHCPCTIDRVKRALTTLGPTQLQEMIDEGEVSTITCQVCGRGYSVGIEDMKDLRDELRKNSMH
jgi:molecular chaperone Hsp33